MRRSSLQHSLQPPVPSLSSGDELQEPSPRNAFFAEQDALSLRLGISNGSSHLAMIGVLVSARKRNRAFSSRMMCSARCLCLSIAMLQGLSMFQVHTVLTLSHCCAAGPVNVTISYSKANKYTWKGWGTSLAW